MDSVVQTVTEEFEGFVEGTEPRLRRALVAAFGPNDGRDATAAALAWAWEHWDEVQTMDNPAGYLYRVGQSSRRQPKVPDVLPEPPPEGPRVEPGLVPALRELSERQRVSVLLIHGYGYSQVEVAALLGIGESSVRNHLRRGLSHLREALGEVEIDA